MIEVHSSFILHPSSFSSDLLPTVAVIPILVGPLQVLLAILPGLLLALGGLILSLFKPATAKRGLKILWRLKIPLVATAAVIVAGAYLLRLVLPGIGGTVSRQETSAQAWPMFRGGLDRAGAVAGGPDPTQSAQNWAFDEDVKTFYSSPAVVGNRVYVASADKGVFRDSGAIYCLDADRGGVVWKSVPKGFRATFSSPAIRDQYLVCGEGLHFTRDARIVCLDITNNGRLLWQYRTESHVESSPCIYKNRVYIGAGDDGYYCFELTPDEAGNPRMVWHVPGERYPDAETSPAVDDGKVFVGLGMGGRAVCCLDAESGREIWRVPTPYPVFSAPTVANGKVFVGMGNGNFIESAEEVMAAELRKLRDGGASETEIAAAETQLRPAGEVWCIDAATSTVEWRYPVSRTVLGTVVAAKDRLFFGSRDGHLYCISTAGKEIGKWNARAPIISSPAIGERHVYFVTSTGRLYALDIETLQPVWETPLGTNGGFLSSPAVARGHVYVGTENQGLLCVGTSGGRGSRPIWAGFLAGPERLGSIDKTPLPGRGALLWRYPETEDQADVASSITAPAACLGDFLFVPVFAGPRKGLACLQHDPEAGQTPEELWFFETPNGVDLSPAATEGAVFVVDGSQSDPQRHLYCLEAKTGSEQWKHEVASDASGQFILQAANDLPGSACIYLQDQPSRLTCLDLRGKRQWSEPVGELCQTPAYKDAILVAALESPRALAAIDARSGDNLWQVELDLTPTAAPVIRKQNIYIGTSEGIAAYRLVDGTFLWQSKTGSVGDTFVMASDAIAYVNAESGLIVLDAGSGEAKKEIEGAVQIPPPLPSSEGFLYASARGLTMYIMDDDRSRRWMSVSWLGNISSPLILANSRVYFATDRKGFICAGNTR